MIPFDMTYHRPISIEEAVQLFETLQQQGKKPLYYGGERKSLHSLGSTSFPPMQ
jgi:CO/xanthine dehydrogenase FAD-binding subunit